MHAAQKRQLSHKSYYRNLAKAKRFRSLSFDKKLETLTYLLQDYGHATGLSTVLWRGRHLPSFFDVKANFYTSEGFLGLKELPEELSEQKARLRSESRKADFEEFESAALPLAEDLTVTLSSDAKLKSQVIGLHDSVMKQLRELRSQVRRSYTEEKEFQLIGELGNVLGLLKVDFAALDTYREAVDGLASKVKEYGAHISVAEAEDKLEATILMLQSEVL